MCTQIIIILRRFITILQINGVKGMSQLFLGAKMIFPVNAQISMSFKKAYIRGYTP